MSLRNVPPAERPRGMHLLLHILGAREGGLAYALSRMSSGDMPFHTNVLGGHATSLNVAVGLLLQENVFGGHAPSAERPRGIHLQQYVTGGLPPLAEHFWGNILLQQNILGRRTSSGACPIIRTFSGGMPFQQNVLRRHVPSRECLREACPFSRTSRDRKERRHRFLPSHVYKPRLDR